MGFLSCLRAENLLKLSHHDTLLIMELLYEIRSLLLENLFFQPEPRVLVRR
jgi:hypothetical protein